jgi:hypothetical protein
MANAKARTSQSSNVFSHNGNLYFILTIRAPRVIIISHVSETPPENPSKPSTTPLTMNPPTIPKENEIAGLKNIHNKVTNKKNVEM